MANPNHDQRGRFASGSAAAASGDHLAAMPHDKSKRTVPGYGTVDRSVPVVPGPRLSQAARDLIIRNKGIDQRAYPNRTLVPTDLIGPQPTAPGKLDPRTYDRPAARAYLQSIRRKGG